ncbi:MAG: transposase [Bacteroidia bacterium]
MIRNEPGRIAEEIWHQIPKQFEKASLGEFILMPNHIHGIIHISNDPSGVEKPRDMTKVETPIYRVSSSVPTSVSTSSIIDPDTDKGGFSGAKNPMFHENLGRIMRWFKGRSTFEIRKVMEDFQWQRNYHDHIIQYESSLHLIETYIQTNPQRWKPE